MRGVWQRFARAVRRSSRARRAAIAVVHALIGTAVVVAVGVLLLWLLQRRVLGSETAAGRIRLAELGVVLILVVVFFLLWAWLHPILKLAGRRRRDAFWLACVGVLVLTAFLSSRRPPDATIAGLIESIGADIAAEIEASGYDVVLVLDPSDPGVRRLVREARERPSALKSSLLSAAERDLRFAVMVVRPPRPAPGWRVPQRLTADRDAVVRAIAAVPIEGDAGSAAGSYAEAISNAAAAPKLGWRPRAAEHSIVLVADRLPTRRELDSAFSRYANENLPPDVAKSARKGDSLVLFGPPSWEQALQRVRIRPFASARVSLSVVTTTARSRRLAAWRRWTARSGGEVLFPSRFAGVRSALDVAELAVIGSPTRGLQQLAVKYRPFLYFDSAEPFGLLNVNDFLRERDRDGTARHQVCEGHWGPRGDECRPFRSVEDFRPDDDYIDFADFHLDDDYIDFGEGPTEEPSRKSGVIYYEVVPKRERLQLAYWWFFRYNESPVGSRFNCLAGLAIAEATCFDHEGDWEGVTVTLDKKSSKPRSVTYYGHGWPGYRFTWDDLTAFESVTGDHPHVYVAFGSHASYPASCDLPRLQCKQLTYQRYGQVLPDGRHNGKVPWYGNEECHDCVQPLPVDGDGRPTSWNRFVGRWGAAECTRVAKMCIKAEGPRTPSRQPRVVLPAPPRDLDFDFLRDFAGS